MAVHLSSAPPCLWQEAQGGILLINPARTDFSFCATASATSWKPSLCKPGQKGRCMNDQNVVGSIEMEAYASGICKKCPA